MKKRVGTGLEADQHENSLSENDDEDYDNRVRPRRAWSPVSIIFIFAGLLLLLPRERDDDSPLAEVSLQHNKSRAAEAIVAASTSIVSSISTSTSTSTSTIGADINNRGENTRAARSGISMGLANLSNAAITVKSTAIISNTSSGGRDLWSLAVAASVPRGQVSKGGKLTSRLDSYEKKRIGPSRHDGKAFKAGEAGCPKVPNYEKLKGGKLVQGDERLKRIHFVHPPSEWVIKFLPLYNRLTCLPPSHPPPAEFQ